MFQAWIEDRSIFPSTYLTVGISRLSSTSRKALFKSAMKSMESADDAAWWSSAAKLCVARNLSPLIPRICFEWWTRILTCTCLALSICEMCMMIGDHLTLRVLFFICGSFTLRATQRNFRRCALEWLGLGQANVFSIEHLLICDC